MTTSMIIVFLECKGWRRGVSPPVGCCFILASHHPIHHPPCAYFSIIHHPLSNSTVHYVLCNEISMFLFVVLMQLLFGNYWCVYVVLKITSTTMPFVFHQRSHISGVSELCVALLFYWHISLSCNTQDPGF